MRRGSHFCGNQAVGADRRQGESALRPSMSCFSSNSLAHPLMSWSCSSLTGGDRDQHRIRRAVSLRRLEGFPALRSVCAVLTGA